MFAAKKNKPAKELKPKSVEGTSSKRRHSEDQGLTEDRANKLNKRRIHNDKGKSSTKKVLSVVDFGNGVGGEQVGEDVNAHDIEGNPPVLKPKNGLSVIILLHSPSWA